MSCMICKMCSFISEGWLESRCYKNDWLTNKQQMVNPIWLEGLHGISHTTLDHMLCLHVKDSSRPHFIGGASNLMKSLRGDAESIMATALEI